MVGVPNFFYSSILPKSFIFSIFDRYLYLLFSFIHLIHSVEGYIINNYSFAFTVNKWIDHRFLKKCKSSFCFPEISLQENSLKKNPSKIWKVAIFITWKMWWWDNQCIQRVRFVKKRFFPASFHWMTNTYKFHGITCIIRHMVNGSEYHSFRFPACV